MLSPLPPSMTRPEPWTPPKIPPIRFDAGSLVLRAYEPGDALALLEAMDVSRATLHPWMPWARTQNRTIEECGESIDRFRRCALDPLLPEHNSTTAYVFGIFDAATGELLGGTGFNRIAPENHNGETGYWVRADRRRRGIAARALAASLSWGFTPQPAGGLGFRRIHIFAAAANTNSCGVPRKLSLHQTTHARLDRWIDGLGWSDMIGWDVLADEWDPRAMRLRPASR